jgi:hypothetical protein
MVSADSTTEASENYSSSEESEKMVHSRTPGPGHGQARTPIPPPPPSGSESDEDSDYSTPPPKTHQQEEQKKEQQPPPSPSPSPSSLISNKTAATKTSVKRPREENDGTPETPSTKKKTTAHTAQNSDEVPAKEKKKAQKKNVAESISTPSSPQKSGKKSLQVWNPKDELAFLNGLLAFIKGGKGFPKNMSPVYDYIRDTMDIQYSNKQFRDKLRRLKAKFQSLMENMGVNNYSFKSTDEAAMYKLCKELWGGEDEGDDEHRHNAETVGKASTNGKDKKKKKKLPVEAEELDEEKTKYGEDQGEEEEEGQDEPKRNKTMSNTLVKSNAGDVEQISKELYSQIREERDDMVNEVKNTVANILKESQAKKKAMLEGYLLNTRADHVQLLYGDLMTGIHSGRRAPVLSRVKAEALEEKWRKQQIMEMKAFSARLDLLQEECEMCLESLGEPVGSGKS